MTTTPKQPIARVLRALREQAGLSVQQLAEKADIHRQTIFKLEADPDREPSLGTAFALADALGIKVDEFRSK